MINPLIRSLYCQAWAPNHFADHASAMMGVHGWIDEYGTFVLKLNRQAGTTSSIIQLAKPGDYIVIDRALRTQNYTQHRDYHLASDVIVTTLSKLESHLRGRRFEENTTVWFDCASYMGYSKIRELIHNVLIHSIPRPELPPTNHTAPSIRFMLLG